MGEERTDVLVVGAGAAGLRAAREASLHGEVMLVSRAPAAQECASITPRPSQYELSRAIDVPETSNERDAFIEESAETGLGAEDPELVRVTAVQAKKEFDRLVEMGVTFEKVEGDHAVVQGCFSRRRRCRILRDLRELGRLMYQEIRGARVRLRPGVQVTRLVRDPSEDRFAGATGFDSEGRPISIRAKACVLAAGGGAGVYRRTFVPDSLVGATAALAETAGAELINLPYVQFMLGAIERDLHPIRLRFFGEPELSNAKGEDVLAARYATPEARRAAYQSRFAHYPFTMHDGSGWIDVEVARASARGGCTLRTATSETPVWVYAHATNGGAKVNVRGGTSVPGLFACGEGAAGMHGANRLGGERLLSSLVFGTRAGHFAGAWAKGVGFSAAPVEAQDPVRPEGLGAGELDNYDGMLRDLMTAKAGVIRRTDELKNAIGVARLVEQVLDNRGCAGRGDAHKFAELRTMAAFSRRMLTDSAALVETRGPHYVES